MLRRGMSRDLSMPECLFCSLQDGLSKVKRRQAEGQKLVNPKCGAGGAGRMDVPLRSTWQTKRGSVCSVPGSRGAETGRGGRPGCRDWVAGRVERRTDVQHCIRYWPLRARRVPQSPNARHWLTELDADTVAGVLSAVAGFQVDCRIADVAQLPTGLASQSGVPLPPPPIPSRAAGAGVARVDGVMSLRQAPDRHIVSSTPDAVKVRGPC